jgi:hypothetical protein
MTEEENLDTGKCKYALIVGKGAYFSDSLFGLFWEMLKHRFSHCRKGHGWID